ncbi:MAG: MATE family efflux transporter [Oscillospiraceae bacterium]|nr:MATE family efflux transporter [Oscillospiraceae bacterium]
MENSNFYGTEKISRILLRLAPPVMLAQLIQALYNIVDSFFIGRWSETALTALSIVFPLQLLMLALGVGTGVGINTAIAHYLGLGRRQRAEEFAGTGTPLAFAIWVVFASVCWFGMPAYAKMSTDSPQVVADVISYGRIVCCISLPHFAECIWAKILQAHGDMKTPMAAQIAGALTNIILDPVLIFGLFGIRPMGVAGAALATVAGQCVAALVVAKKALRKSPPLRKYPFIVCRVYALGTPNILMQAAYTFYILGFNLILASFCDQAVTALGLYYKWQTFFIIPLNAMQTCIVPIVSYNLAAKQPHRCRTALLDALAFGMLFITVGVVCFEFFPAQLIRLFSRDVLVAEIGITGFRIIGLSFYPIITSLTYPVFFQALGQAGKSSMLTVLRTVVLFVPLGFVFSRFGLTYFWLTYPVTELITSAVGYVFYRQFVRDYCKNPAALQDSI